MEKRMGYIWFLQPEQSRSIEVIETLTAYWLSIQLQNKNSIDLTVEWLEELIS